VLRSIQQVELRVTPPCPLKIRFVNFTYILLDVIKLCQELFILVFQGQYLFLKLLIHQSFVIIFLLKVIVVVHAFYLYLTVKLGNLLLIIVKHPTLIFRIIFDASHSCTPKVYRFV
jgi:hypothetical protein